MSKSKTIKKLPEEIIYSINTTDIQEVSQDVLQRNLTQKELAVVKNAVGNYIDWVQAIEHAINQHIEE